MELGTDRRLSLAQNPVVRGNVARPLAAVEMRLWIAANEEEGVGAKT